MSPERSDGRSSSLRESTFSGVRWSGGAHVVKQAIKLGVAVVLARLLSPEPFGIIGMVLVITGFMNVISNLGFGSALVQRQELREDHITGAFWASVSLGVLLTTLCVTVAPWVSDFYGETSVEPVLEAMAAVFVLGALVVVPKSLLQRRMDFRSIAKVEVFALVLAGSLAIVAALLGAGVWSLVTHQLAIPALEAAAIWAFVGWRPKARIQFRGVRDLAHYSLNLTGFNLVNYWARHTDDLLIGRVMGSASLGLYDLAYRVMLFPIRQVIDAISRVIFPTLSSVQHDRSHMRRIFLRVMRVLAFVIFPVMGCVAVLADVLVLGVFGEQWAGAIPILPVFCLVGMIQTLGNPTGWLYTATGRTDWMMWWGIAGGGTLILAIAIGVWLGSIETVAWAYAGANAVLLYPMVMIPGKLVGMSFSDVLRSVSRAGLATGGMAAVIFLIKLELLTDWSPVRSLFVLIPASIVVYVGLSLLINREGCQEVLEAADELIPKKSTWLERLRKVL